MRRCCYILFLLVLLSACGDNREVVALLDHAEAVMEEHPDSAYQFLCEADSCIAEQSKGTRMRHLMLMTEAKNKLDMPLPSDTLFQEVVDYYDDHGTSNQQLMAHYLLGCIYRDKKEAPMALQCYNDAVEKADTTSNDCDYTLLYKVYGQMADVYGKQLMPEEALEAEEKYSHYALQAKDTFNYIKGIEMMVIPYYSMCDTTNVFRSTFESARLYKKHGYPREAANVYHEVIDIYLGTAQYEKAHELMQICENESGLFDENGEPQKKSYYYNKGRYYAGVNMLDSAELCFRKLLNAGYEYYAYKGLLSCYLKRRDTDSIVKYSSLCEDGLMHFLSQNQIDKVVVASSLYDYSRHQQAALKKTYEAKQERRTKWMILFVSLLVIGIIVGWYIKRRKESIVKTRRLNAEYTKATTKLQQAKRELSVLKESLSDMKENVLSAKQNEIDQLNTTIQSYQEKFDAMLSQEKEMALMESDLVKAFKSMSHPKKNSSLPTDSDWEDLIALLQQCLPLFMGFITQEHLLAGQELYTAILSRLNFSTGEISILLSTSQQRITNVKKKINHKLFDEESATTLTENLRKARSVNKV